MRIRSKIILVVLPLIVTPLFLIALASILTARNGITGVATEFLRFKAEELAKYAESQWTLLVENGLSERKEFVDISKAAIGSFALSMIRSHAELILAVDETGALTMKTSDVTLLSQETRALASLASARAEGWRQLQVGGIPRVGQAVYIAPFGWYAVITVARDSFYEATNQILLQSALILGGSAALSLALLFVFSGYLTRPLRGVVGTMRNIIASRDLSQRVALLYRDETGELGHTFNLMTGELESAYDQIKGYALETAIAKKREQKIRNIFQRYVPREVIDTFFRNPESMLVGDNRVLAVLFSDIRGFTAISERMRPDELVESLNAYFGLMVDVITSHSGIVDKYIGDAIMAFYGAPVRHGDDAYQSVLSALDMIDALGSFNADQGRKGRPGFRIGIGINYGMVTVGNIGSEKKMDYTVIGDMVNLASRLEGLTKIYREQLIFSESVFRSVGEKLPCRKLDCVAVRGKSQGVSIYTARRRLDRPEEEGWGLHQLGLDLYYKREFEKAASFFAQAGKFLADDWISRTFLERCRMHVRIPPPPEWNGVIAISEK